MADATYIHGTDPDEQQRLAALNRMTNGAFLDFLTLEPQQEVLEIGSGLGILAAEAADRVPRGRVVGLERSADQLAKVPRDVPNLSFVQGDAHALPFDDGGFDVVYCRYLLEHVADPVRVLREAHRVLRFGGRICLQENDISLVRHDPATPAFYKVWTAFARLQTQLGGDALIGRTLFRLLREAGFGGDVVLSTCPEVYWFGQPGFGPWLVNLIGNIRSGQTGLIEHGLVTLDEVNLAIGELEALIANSHGSTWFYWNRGVAIK